VEACRARWGEFPAIVSRYSGRGGGDDADHELAIDAQALKITRGPQGATSYKLSRRDGRGGGPGKDAMGLHLAAYAQIEPSLTVAPAGKRPAGHSA